jgi:nicotinate-nucleotide pyrophosphorylase (carboxylating)
MLATPPPETWMPLVIMALCEDTGVSGEPTATERKPAFDDLSSRATIPPDLIGAAVYRSRKPGVICGLTVAAAVAQAVSEGLPQSVKLTFEPLIRDGDRVQIGDAIARISGGMRGILMAERTSLNFLQRLSGVATLTRQYVDRVVGTHAVILDTRKTTPGYRSLEKYAVACGGGTNHRLGLHDAILIKDNHLAALRSKTPGGDEILAVVEQSRLAYPRVRVEVEVDSLEQLDRALAARPDVILLDNMPPDMLVQAVRKRDHMGPGILLEASGGVNLNTVGAIASTGVDRISVGALTHSAPALDIGLDWDD